MGQPLSGVVVRRLQPCQVQMPASEDQWTTITATGLDGYFSADLTTTKSFIVLSKPGFATLALDAQKPLEPAVNLLQGAELSATVLDEKGTSIPNALVGPISPMLQLPDKTAEAPPVNTAGAPVWVRTDDRGHFHVRDLSPGLQGFLVQADGFAPHMAVRPTGTDTTISLSTAGTTWSGVLVGSRDHKPQSGIYLEAVSGLLRVNTKTDSAGQFTFPLLPGDDWQFRTAVAPIATAKAAMIGHRARTVDGNTLTILHNQGVVIAGVLHDPATRAPIADVPLQLDAFQGEQPLTASSDSNGSFRFENADAFRALTLRFENYVARTPQNTYWSEVSISTLKAEDITTLSYQLLSRVTTHGRVHSPEGRPVPDVTVALKLRKTSQPGFADFLGRVKYQAKSKVTGEFDVTLFPPGIYEVEANAQSLASGRQYYDASTSPPQQLNIDLKPLMSIRGRTLDAAGEPLADCRVELSAVTDVAQSSSPTHLADSTRSNGNGKFEFEGAFPSTLRLTAMHPSSDDSVTTDLVGSASTTGPIDLQFPQGKLFIAHVIDANGAPLPGTSVQVYADQAADSDSSNSKLLSRRTDADGRAAFGLQARRILKVTARHKEFAPFSDGPISLPDEHFEIQLKPNPSIQVTVSGKPASDEEVRQIWLLRAEREPSGDPLSSFFQSVRRQESRDGTAGFKDVQPGWYKVSTANGSIYGETEAFQVTADSGETKINLPLAEGAMILGRVLDDDSGQPVKGAQVSIQLPCCTPQGFESDPVDSDADGKYQLGGLPAGAMLLSVKHPNYSDSAMHVLVPKSGEKTIDLKLGHGASVLSGRVTLDGKPLPNAAIYIYRAANRNEYAESGVTGADGRYSIEGIPEGNHVIQVQALYGPEQVDLRRSMELRVKGRTAKMDVDFHGLVHLSGRLRMNPEEEGPNPHTSLWFAQRSSAEDLGQSFRSTNINAEGDYEIYLEPGSYTIGLQEGTGMPIDVPEGAAEFTVNFELRDLAEASGIKLVPAGAPVEPKEVPDNKGL